MCSSIHPLGPLLLIGMLTTASASAPSTPLPEVTAAIARIESRVSEPRIPEITINLVDHSGLAPDPEGTHDFRAAIQAALDDLAAQGGGTLLVPHPLGRDTWVKPTVTYRIRGGIELRSHTRLLLEPAVRLYFECSPVDYTDNGQGVLIRYEGTTVYGHQPLIRAFNAHDIAISAVRGHGAMPEITGDGEAWLRWEAATGIGPSIAIRAANNDGIPLARRRATYPQTYFRRPSMLHFVLCRTVLVEDVKLTNAPFWVVHPAFSENLIFRRLFFDCQNVNNDGIDVDSSRDVLIEDVIFNNHDDNVVLKSGRDREGREGVDVRGTELARLSIDSPYLREGRLGGPTEDVVVRRCAFKGHYALAVGSEMSGGVRRLYAVDNLALQRIEMLVFVKSSRVRGGLVEQLHVHGFRARDVNRDVIALIPNYDGDTTSPHVPDFRDIHLSDIDVGSAGRAVSVQGWREKPIARVTLSNVRVGTVTRGAEAVLDVSGVENLVIRDTVVAGRRLDGEYTIPAGDAPRHQN